ncbi:hypothetical protein T484DRAFT_1846759 [Baffinella frigidus]|nr:hypothetical protein T484DRAFT_1846759 [Cryptophyta sp. CCMP2293]
MVVQGLGLFLMSVMQVGGGEGCVAETWAWGRGRVGGGVRRGARAPLFVGGGEGRVGEACCAALALLSAAPSSSSSLQRS